MPLPGSLPPCDAPVTDLSRATQYSDFDVNGHVNNTRYVDWFMNQFPVEKHRRQMLGDLLVHYNAEVTPEEKLVMEVCQAGEASTLRGLHGDTVCFAVEGLWRDRA